MQLIISFLWLYSVCANVACKHLLYTSLLPMCAFILRRHISSPSVRIQRQHVGPADRWRFTVQLYPLEDAKALGKEAGAVMVLECSAQTGGGLQEVYRYAIEVGLRGRAKRGIGYIYVLRRGRQPARFARSPRKRPASVNAGYERCTCRKCGRCSLHRHTLSPTNSMHGHTHS